MYSPICRKSRRNGRGKGGVGCTSGSAALSRGARVFPRGAPGVAATSGRSGGWRCPGCARHPGTSQGGVNPEVRPKKCSVFMVFGLFWLTFTCCVSDFLPLWVRFSKKKSRGGGTSGCPPNPGAARDAPRTSREPGPHFCIRLYRPPHTDARGPEAVRGAGCPMEKLIKNKAKPSLLQIV